MGGIDNPFNTLGCKYLFFVCRYHLHSIAWFSYWFDNLGLISEGNTYRRSAASSLPLWVKPTQLQATSPLPQKEWVTLLHFIYCYHYLLVINYLAIKLLVTDNFSACRDYLAENHLSFPSALCWVPHSYLPKGLRLIPYTYGSSRLFSGTVSRE